MGACLTARYDIKGDISDLEESFETYEKARIAFDRLFFTTTIQNKIDLLRDRRIIDDNLVYLALRLRKISVEQQCQNWSRRALIIAEGTKSRLFAELSGR
ncbi:MAG TPA: hypothetical protein PLR04_02390, partial [Bacilli bacterium]|nr:hypothetical protein [Bacilli bacterium]